LRGGRRGTFREYVRRVATSGEGRGGGGGGGGGGGDSPGSRGNIVRGEGKV